MGDIADAMLEGAMCEQCGVYLGEGDGYPRLCGGCQSDEKEVEVTTCQRTIKEKGWPGHTQRKCGRAATHKQNDGLPLCERHYNKWRKKNG